MQVQCLLTSLRHHKVATISLIHSIIMFKDSVLIAGRDLNSTCVEGMLVNPWRGRASVQFWDGSFYNYENVSRRACFKFLLDKGGRSMGKFLNNVLKQDRVYSYGF